MEATFRRTFVFGGLLALVASAVAVGGVSAKPSGDGPGNAPNAKACQKDGWENLVREDGSTFANQDECVSYAAQGGVLQPKPLTPLELCKQQLAAAGLSEPANANYILGTDGDDDFTSQMTEGNDVVCGFGGSDQIGSAAELEGDDIFLGGAGTDVVTGLGGGTFNGGDGNDVVEGMGGGTFNGGDGNDFVEFLLAGTVNGGAGDDVVFAMNDGTFYGGDGNDSVGSLFGGTFNGEGGCDTVATQSAGTFNPGDQSTCTA